MRIREELKKLGLEIPGTPKPTARYIPAIRIGNIVYSSGQGPDIGDKIYRGRLGENLSLEEGYECARNCALNCLSAIEKAIGDLDKVDKVIKVLGFIRSGRGFDQQSQVLNGASELFEYLFGEKGKHARSAIGVNELPMGIPVEVEVIIEIKEC